SEVNSGRLLRPEDHLKDFELKTNVTRSGVGYSIPSTFTTGYRYARMGYTTVMNPSMPPLEARHTHEELCDTPIIDKATYSLLGDWWFVLENLRDGKIEECASHVAWMLSATKGYAIKIVNPGGLEAWGFGRNVRDFEDTVPYFNITPKEIVQGLCRVNRMLNLPHTIHVHTNNLGKPGNYETTIQTMKSVENLTNGDKPSIHITHCQFSAFKGETWDTLTSGADEISKYVNNHRHVTMDMGQVIFTDTTTMTADGPFQHILHQLSGNKWVNHDVETETSAGIVPFRYRRKSYVHATQWSIGLELALMIKDPWRIFLTTDHPNGGPFTSYPNVLGWLMSRKARENTLKKLNRRSRQKSVLPSIDREYSLFEIAVVTRAGTAKALGLKDKGHLGPHADADIAVYDVNPREVDPSTEYKKYVKAFQRAKYTIKEGEIVVKDGEVVKVLDGKTFWVKVNTSLQQAISENMKKRFSEYWTVQFENYPVSEGYLKRSNPIILKSEV
ncbi:MAG: formylmethanofuran dehydrogenase subunit A, partial [Candidatus Bathyarchaeia archaeon]